MREQKARDVKGETENSKTQMPNSKKKSLSDYVRDFLEYCEIDRGHSPLTVTNYAHYLERFLNFCEQKNIKDPQGIDQEVIHSYRLWLNRITDSPASDTGSKKRYILPSKALSKTTQNYHLIALRSFLRFLLRRDIPSLAPERIDLADTPDREIEFLSEDELRKVFEIAAKRAKTLLGARDYAILTTLFSTGLRVAELTALLREQVNLKSDELSVIGKGGKARLVFISPLARDALANYLRRRRDKDPALFVRHGKAVVAKATPSNLAVKTNTKPTSLLRLTPRTIQRIIKSLAKRAGISKDVHPHTLRHSFATDLLGNGADIRSVQQLLGHSSITTTQLYTHVTNKQLREIHKKYHSH